MDVRKGRCMKIVVNLICFMCLSSCFAKEDKKAIVPKTATPKKIQREMSDLLETEKRIIDVYHSVVGSVVNVSNIRVSDSFFYGKAEVPQGTGTGFVWDDKGHIVTNFHVVQGGDTFTVTFKNDKKQYKAEVVGVAPKKDIAVLKLKEMPSELKPVSAGNVQGPDGRPDRLGPGKPFRARPLYFERHYFRFGKKDSRDWRRENSRHDSDRCGDQ